MFKENPPARFDPFAQVLPHAEDSERFAIASALQHENRLREYMGLLNTEHFSSERHRVLWEAMRALYDSDAPVTLNSVVCELNKTPGKFESAGGAGYAMELTESMPDVRIDQWARPILETYARRRLMLKFNESMIRLSDRSEPLGTICQELEDESRSCALIGDTTTGFATFVDVVRECGGMDAFLARGAGDAIPYPWQSLNELTNGGMRPGQVIVIGGPSGQGKTALALNIAMRAARSGAGAPAVFSLEMDKADISTRNLALASMVDSYHFRRPDENERSRIRSGSRFLAEHQILIDDEVSASVSSIRSKVKRLMGLETISMILVDYIQLVEGNRGKGETREQEIARVMRGLKRMAMQLKVPVVALSQINEDAGAGTREPELKDLRESRSIGHNANMVAFLYFTKHYDVKAGIPTGELDLIIRKQRSGPEGRVKLIFHAPTGRFYEADGSGESNER